MDKENKEKLSLQDTPPVKQPAYVYDEEFAGWFDSPIRGQQYVAQWKPSLHFIETIAPYSGTHLHVEHDEHEKTRELIAEKLEDLAKKEDVILAKEEIIERLEIQLRNLQESLEKATAELAKSKDLEICATRLSEEVRKQGEATRMAMTEKIADLQRYLSKFAPQRRFFKVTFGFFSFFVVSMLIGSLFGIRIVEPFWGAIGIALTAAMLVVIYFGMKDIEERMHRPEKF